MDYIQIIGYRERLHPTTNKTYLKQDLFNVEVSNSLSLYTKTEEILSTIPESERYDLHYTNAICKKPDINTKPRTFSLQDQIPIDIDDVDLTRAQEYVDIFFSTVNVDRNKCPVICSGNGIHIIVLLNETFDLVTLKRLQPHYKEMCNKLNEAFFKAGLQGTVDPIRLADKSTLRMPLTENRKHLNSIKMSYYIARNVGTQTFDIESMFPVKSKAETQEEKIFQVDTPAVLQGCNFLNYCKDNPNKLTEYQWYAMIQTLVYIPTIGDNLVHSYSEMYHAYDRDETELKIQHAKSFGKPRTCDSIDQIWNRCNECPFYGKCKTPLQIRSKEFIATQKTGFHHVTYRKDGSAHYVPDYDGLLEYLKINHPFINDCETRITYTYEKTHWVEFNDLKISAFANDNFKPTAKNNMRSEFLGLVKNSNLVSGTFIGKDNEGYINFVNGVLCIKTKELKPHSQDFGFTYCLPYPYMKHATCPNFDQLLDNITLKDISLQNILMEFFGYAISGRPNSWIQKALILTGGGSNGKSTFLNIMRRLVGEECYTALSIASMGKENFRYTMKGKLFNISFDEDPKALIKGGVSVFKAITAGDPVDIRKLYANPITEAINCKLIVGCNTLPETNDHTHAVYRRMLIVPFRAKFEGDTDNKDITDTIYPEMSGIYNRVIEGLDRLIKNKGQFSASTVSDRALKEYKYETAIYQRFFEDCFEIAGENDFISMDEVMSEFKLWTERNNEFHNISSIKLAKELKNLKLIPTDSCVRKYGNATKRGYSNIKKLNQLF